ncbi:MAG: DUF1292 domain-containing protein [Streptococcaceae bacterium]|jgi:uncharacterized protein YrzB (UPF0473 family)|nr:DUF1292 domain-containing protein [Streptococcaceae bacterium]
MADEHVHEPNENEADNLITLIDDEGNEVLFEVLLTINGQEEFGKNYVLMIPAGADEGDDEVEISVYSFTENEDGTEGGLEPVPEGAEDEWAMIEDVFNQYTQEHGEN